MLAGLAAVRFCFRYPRFLFDATLLSFSATAGQFCIYTTIREFGAVVFAACMNVRQVRTANSEFRDHAH